MPNGYYLWRNNMFIIYEIKNKITGKRYIGSSKDYKVRWKRHLNELLKDKHHCSYLQRSFNKHGSEAFSFSIIKELNSIEEMLSEEELLLNSNEDLFNSSKQASGGDLISYHPDIENIKEKHRGNYYLNIDSITGKHKYLNHDVSGSNNPNYKSRTIYGIVL